MSRAVDQGWGQLFPLQACALGDQEAGSVPPHRAGLWHVPAPLLVSAFKKAWAGRPDEYILRLWNPTNAAVERACITSDLFAVGSARLNDHLERDLGVDVPVKEWTCAVPVAAHAMVTLRLTLAAKGG